MQKAAGMRVPPVRKDHVYQGRGYFAGLRRVTKRNKATVLLPWIPEPSTVNNKLKCREGSGSTGRFFD